MWGKMNQTHRIEALDSSKDTSSWKRGTRVLGVAESFRKSDKKGVVAGIVMRGDIRIDGTGVCRPTVGGTDSTDELISMYHRLRRSDIRAWMLGGSAISWFNIIDLVSLHENTGVPIACVTYHSSEGIEKYLREYFPSEWEDRLAVLERAGERTLVPLRSGYSVYINNIGMSLEKAQRLVDLFTLDGRVPEPIRVARLLAATLRQDLYDETPKDSVEFRCLPN
jgi:endonuclease V-like protein UPF0215 family